MLIRLISLVILLLLIDVNHKGLTNEKFILPKDKPSVFKKIEKSKSQTREIIPQSKPIIKTKRNLEIKKEELKKEIVKKRK